MYNQLLNDLRHLPIHRLNYSVCPGGEEKRAPMTNVRETISQLLYLDVCPQPASWRDANQKEAYQQMTTFSLTGRDDLIIFDLKTSQE